MNGPKYINLTVIREFSDSIVDILFFLEHDLRTKINIIKTCKLNGNEIFEIGHFFKGTGLQLGINHLTDQAIKLEKMRYFNHISRDHLNQILIELEKILLEINNLICQMNKNKDENYIIEKQISI